MRVPLCLDGYTWTYGGGSGLHPRTCVRQCGRTTVGGGPGEDAARGEAHAEGGAPRYRRGDDIRETSRYPRIQGGRRFPPRHTQRRVLRRRAHGHIGLRPSFLFLRVGICGFPAGGYLGILYTGTVSSGTGRVPHAPNPFIRISGNDHP